MIRRADLIGIFVLAWANVILLAGQAAAGVVGGTLIVFVPAEDKFIVAADSRSSMLIGKGTPDDNQCKIFPIYDHFVFATSGNVAYTSHSADDPVSAWTNWTEAKKVVHARQGAKGDAQKRVDRVADSWTEDMKSKWETLYLHHKDLVEQATKPPAFGLTTGIFATAKNGKLAFAIRAIVLEKSRIVAIPSTCDHGHYCSSGDDDIFMEFSRQTSPRAVTEFSKWTESAAAESKRKNIELRTLYAIRLLELTEVYDSSGSVGGPVDALELLKDGTIVWAQVKPSCGG